MNATSDFYPRRRNFNFPQRSQMNIRMRRDSCYHFNNRNSNFHWDRFHGAPRTPSPWSWTRSQAAKTSFAPVNPYRQSIPKFPANLVITIPNFSDARPPDLFVFRNSSAKSVRFATSAPGSVFPQPSSCSSVSKDVENNMKSNENDDVQYLYTVQTKDAEFVEVVDLSEDSKGLGSDHLIPSNGSSNLKERGKDSSNLKECGNDRRIQRVTGFEAVPSSEKENAAHQKSRKRKKSYEDLYCDICESEYNFIRNRGEEMFKARCGHMFCQQCLKELDPYKCPECNLYLQKVFKVFL